MARQLTLAGIGQRIVAHVGGDTVIGRNPHEYLQALADDEATAAVLFCGEIGGDKEYAFAEAARGFPKPVYAMVVGRHAPAEKQMGHAGALIGSAREGADAKLKALAAAGCRIVKGPEQAVAMLSELNRAALRRVLTQNRRSAPGCRPGRGRAPCDRADNVPATRRAPSRGRDRSPSVRPCRAA